MKDYVANNYSMRVALCFAGLFLCFVVTAPISFFLEHMNRWEMALWVAVYLLLLMMGSFSKSRAEYLASSGSFAVIGIFLAMRVQALKPFIGSVLGDFKGPFFNRYNAGPALDQLMDLIGVVVGVATLAIAANLLTHAMTIAVRGLPGKRVFYSSPVTITSNQRIELEHYGEDEMGESRIVIAKLEGRLYCGKPGESVPDLKDLN